MARITCECIAEGEKSYESKKGTVRSWVLGLVDKGPVPRIDHSFEYECSPEEELALKGTVIDKKVELAVQGLPTSDFGSASRVRGQIVGFDGKPFGKK